jgi:Ni2+-binding GTPase involved in maturation of urease and hydrogenase
MADGGLKFVTVAGPPSCGKTSVILRTVTALAQSGAKVGVVKFDCLTSEDPKRYEAAGIAVKKGLAGGVCPDHFFIANIEEALQWGRRSGFDLLISESAGLCNRCSPHIRGVLAVCVIDHLSGVATPRKIGPMLKNADLVVLTKGDIVSQAEREVFAFRVRQVNAKAAVLPVNGLTGQGSLLLRRHFLSAPAVESLEGFRLRFTMPAALCSYCLGETKIGPDCQIGNIRTMDFS